MNNDELREYAVILVPPRTRWLAIAAACVSGVAGLLALGLAFPIVSSILVLGAILQRWSPHPGRWLMWFGAFYLSMNLGFLAPLGFRMQRPLDPNILTFTSAYILSLVLMGWCDIALVIDSVKSKNTPALQKQWFPRAADWIVGVIVLCLNTWAVWSILAGLYPVRRFGRWYFLLLFVMTVAAFDAALINHAIRMFRVRRVARA